MRDDLGDHGVEEGGDLIALGNAAVDSDLARQTKMLRSSRCREKPGGGIFSVKPSFYGPAIDGQFVLRQGQSLARGNAELPLHEILARDSFGDRMLDLQPGVHLHEPDPIGPQPLARIRNEFDGARPHIIHRCCGSHGSLSDHLPE